MKTHTFGTLIAMILMGLGLDLYAQSNEYIRRKSEELTGGANVQVENEMIYCQKLLPEFYQRRNFVLAWNGDNITSLLDVLEKADAEGLKTSDYHFLAISQLSTNARTEVEKGELDLLLTDAFLLCASHFLNGKVNPETVDGDWKAIRREGNAREFMERTIASNSIAEGLMSLEPKHLAYAGLKVELKKYIDISKGGGWEPIPKGETLKVGMLDDLRIPLLVARLMATGDLVQRPTDGIAYSGILSNAVKAYQKRNGLEEDGNLGKNTTLALNVPVGDRIDKIKVNMERYRWISQELGIHYVIVNIADYQMQVFKEKKLEFEEKVIVGKPFRKTPVCSSKMTYLVLNPTWTVPPTILFNDILPEAKKDPNYLNKKNIRVIQGQGSNAVILDPKDIDWPKLSKNYFPYTLRQDPGLTNALGQVKFMFPNQYNVYIHDTPSKELFSRPDRAFSSGCIRLNNPLAFAKYLLKDNPKLDAGFIAEILIDGKEKSVMLPKPINVHILYLTSWVEGGKVQFRNDLYNRDAPLLSALNELPPTF